MNLKLFGASAREKKLIMVLVGQNEMYWAHENHASNALNLQKLQLTIFD